MIILANNLSSEIKELESVLLTQLDENKFFLELSDFFKNQVVTDNIQVSLVYENLDIKKIIQDGNILVKQVLISAQGIDNYVLSTKRAYFSNNVSRDPLFAQSEGTQIQCAMCIPVMIEGVVIAIINFSGQDTEMFNRDMITNILSILNEVVRPISNIKMYLQAKQLNEALLKQIELKEREIEQQKNGLIFRDSNRFEDQEIIGISEATTRLKNIADKLACVDSNFILQGDSGIGKELLARKIHSQSKRKNGNFATMDCSSLNEKEMELELFGEEMIVDSAKKGLLELNRGGTLLIKNIHYMNERLQSKLYYVLKDNKATRVGGESAYQVDVRISATSMISIQEEVDNGHFREDLFYGIGKIIVIMTSLQDRVDDIEVLANYFLNDGHAVSEHKILSPDAINMLKEYNWPGNIRELKNTMEGAYIVSGTSIIEKEHLIDKLHNNNNNDNLENEQLAQDDYIEMTLEELEQHHIVKTLDFLSGNKTKTAKVLGITVKTLYNKLHNYGMISPKEV